MQTSIRTITPSEAADLLEHNMANQRHLDPQTVERYAADMRAGAWEVTGASIVVNGDGTLLDGQHRLAACKRSGIPFTTVWVEGAAAAALTAVDTGRRRQFSDLLKMMGYANSKRVATGVRQLWLWETTGLAYTRQASNHQLLAWLNSNRDRTLVADKMASALVTSDTIRMPIGAATSLTFAALTVEPDDRAAIKEFVGEITSGVGLDEDNPALHMRNWLVKRLQRPASAGRPNATHCLAVGVKAWNAWIGNVSMSALKWTRSGSRRERVPTVYNAAATVCYPSQTVYDVDATGPGAD